MFKVGDRLVAIAQYDYMYDYKKIKNKVFVILEINKSDNYVGIVLDDDNNINRFGYNPRNFMLLSEYRKQKLNKIEKNVRNW